MTAVATIPGMGLSHLPVTFHANGLEIEPGVLSEAQYLELCDALRHVHSATLWWWGDCLNLFERDWGERYTQALDESDYSYQSLRNAKWVCGKFPLSNRLDKLGFLHHQIMAGMEDTAQRDALLNSAAREKWSAATLRLARKQEDDPFAQPATFAGTPYTPVVLLPDVLQWIEQHPQAAETIQRAVGKVKENHQLLNASGNNEWYTPRPFLDAAHELMGGVDLDPASNEFANLTVRAARYYSIDDDGMALPWFGRVWMNPPYGTEEGESNQSRWTDRLIREHQSGAVTEALILVNAVTGNHWFRPLKQYPICFPDSRIRFYNEQGELGQPTHSNAIVYLGPQVARFAAIFARFGAVLATREVWDGAA